jgi:hypothetical protein
VAENKLGTAVNKALTKVSSPAAIKRFLAAMQEEGLLHVWPGKSRTKSLALQPFDAVSLITFKKPTLADLRAVLAKVEPLGVSLDRFLQALRHMLGTDGGGDESRSAGVAARPAGQEQQVMELAGSLTMEPPPPPAADSGGSLAELKALILKGMRDLDPGVENGATVLIRDLRRHMPPEYRTHASFDPAVMGLAEEEKVVLHRHDHPFILTDAERDELVRDPEAGTYFTSLALRV